MGKNDVKYIFGFTCQVNRRISTCFDQISERVTHKGNCDVYFFQNIVMMDKNDVKELKH